MSEIKHMLQELQSALQEEFPNFELSSRTDQFKIVDDETESHCEFRIVGKEIRGNFQRGRGSYTLVPLGVDLEKAKIDRKIKRKADLKSKGRKVDDVSDSELTRRGPEPSSVLSTVEAVKTRFAFAKSQAEKEKKQSDLLLELTENHPDTYVVEARGKSLTVRHKEDLRHVVRLNILHSKVVFYIWGDHEYDVEPTSSAVWSEMSNALALVKEASENKPALMKAKLAEIEMEVPEFAKRMQRLSEKRRISRKESGTLEERQAERAALLEARRQNSRERKERLKRKS